MYAIIETGGKQYKVREGDTVDVELLGGEIGDTVELDQVLLVAGDDGMSVGTPTVEDARVRATVIGKVKGDKIVVFKYKPKNRYRRKTGHRQKYTRLRIERIIAPGMEEVDFEEETVEPVQEMPAAETAIAEAAEPAAPMAEAVAVAEPATTEAPSDDIEAPAAEAETAPEAVVAKEAATEEAEGTAQAEETGTAPEAVVAEEMATEGAEETTPPEAAEDVAQTEGETGGETSK